MALLGHVYAALQDVLKLEGQLIRACAGTSRPMNGSVGAIAA